MCGRENSNREPWGTQPCKEKANGHLSPLSPYRWCRQSRQNAGRKEGRKKQDHIVSRRPAVTLLGIRNLTQSVVDHGIKEEGITCAGVDRDQHRRGENDKPDGTL